MKIKGLIRSSEFRHNLEKKFNSANIHIEFIDYEKPIESQIQNSNIIINGFENMEKSLIDSCPDLKLIQQSGIGVDGIDINYCSKRGIYVANVPMANAISVAEHTIFLILYLAKNIKLNHIDERSNTNHLFIRKLEEYPGSEIYKKTILIIGLGVTGIEVAKRAKAFGMKVMAITKHPLTKTEGGDKKYYVDNIYGTDKLLDVIPSADIITIHTPLNKDTENMIGEKEFELMKPTTYVINVARANVINKNALHDALLNKKIAGAAFDVFWKEPAPPNDDLLKLTNFILTPHVAGWTSEAIDAIVGIISINIERMLRGHVPLTVVNQELINRFN